MYSSPSFNNDVHVADSVSSYSICIFHPKLDRFKANPRHTIFSSQTIWSSPVFWAKCWLLWGNLRNVKELPCRKDVKT